MSAENYILLSALWVLLVWMLSVGASKMFSSLTNWPEYWLAVIVVGFGTPAVSILLLAIGLQAPIDVAVFKSVTSLPIVSARQGSLISVMMQIAVPVSLLVYFSGVIIHLFRLSIGWRQLSKAVRNKSTKLIHGNNVVVTDGNEPPCAFGVFQPVIIIPTALHAQLKPAILKLILNHEAAHIQFKDPTIMFCLHVAKALFWPHPAIHALVKRWQFGSELRADNIALMGADKHLRKAYGQILVKVLRTYGAENRRKEGKGTLPCPSATLNLNNYRSAKMRVENILNQEEKSFKTNRLKVGLYTLTCVALMSGSYGLVAAAGPSPTSDRDTQPIVRYPPIFPANCVANKGSFAASVSVIFDVNKTGKVENVRVINSDNPCFNQSTVNSVSKWKYAPILKRGKPRKRTGVQSMIKYTLTSD